MPALCSPKSDGDSVRPISMPILVASLPDIIRSRRAAGRPRDLAVLEILETTLEQGAKPPGTTRRRPARK
jgi:hypothetical protein